MTERTFTPMREIDFLDDEEPVNFTSLSGNRQAREFHLDCARARLFQAHQLRKGSNKRWELDCAAKWHYLIANGPFLFSNDNLARLPAKMA